MFVRYEADQNLYEYENTFSNGLFGVACIVFEPSDRICWCEFGASDQDSILFELIAPSNFPEGWPSDVPHFEGLKSVFDGSSDDNYVVRIVRLKKKFRSDILLWLEVGWFCFSSAYFVCLNLPYSYKSQKNSFMCFFWDWFFIQFWKSNVWKWNWGFVHFAIFSI